MNQFQEEFFNKHSYYRIVGLLLQKGESVKIPLAGHCMSPLLRENDFITIKPVGAKEVQSGDVVIFKTNDRIICHRLLRFKITEGERFIITKSDRGLYLDSPVPFRDLLGKVVKVEKENRGIDYDSMRWRIINFLLGKLSPYISKVEYPIWKVALLFRKYISITRH